MASALQNKSFNAVQGCNLRQFPKIVRDREVTRINDGVEHDDEEQDDDRREKATEYDKKENEEKMRKKYGEKDGQMKEL